MKLTRRELATTALLSALVPTPAPAQEPEPFKAAADSLSKFEIPMATEPSFVFKP